MQIIKKGISTLCKLEDIIGDQSTSITQQIMPQETTTTRPPSFVDSEAYEYIALQETKPIKTASEEKEKYSYALRRQRLGNQLFELEKKYPGYFYIQIQDKKIRKTAVGSYKDLPILIFDYTTLEQKKEPALKEIEERKREDTIIFDDKNHQDGYALQDQACQYRVRWTPKEDELWLEVYRLKEPTNTYHGEVYFHAIFSKDLENCIHSDAHYFMYDAQNYTKRQNGERAELKKSIVDGTEKDSKFYHFYYTNSKNPISSIEGIQLCTAFFDDPRIEKYMAPLIQEIKKRKISSVPAHRQS